MSRRSSTTLRVRALAQGALLFGSWFLVQVPSTDMPVGAPHGNTSR